MSRMGLDIRLPLGLLFTILGVLLAAYGLLGGASINLWWGLVMLVFGGTMLFLTRRRG